MKPVCSNCGRGARIVALGVRVFNEYQMVRLKRPTGDLATARSDWL
jgi:hypothetical protein